MTHQFRYLIFIVASLLTVTYLAEASSEPFSRKWVVENSYRDFQIAPDGSSFSVISREAAGEKILKATSVENFNWNAPLEPVEGISGLSIAGYALGEVRAADGSVEYQLLNTTGQWIRRSSRPLRIAGPVIVIWDDEKQQTELFNPYIRSYAFLDKYYESVDFKKGHLILKNDSEQRVVVIDSNSFYQYLDEKSAPENAQLSTDGKVLSIFYPHESRVRLFLISSVIHLELDNPPAPSFSFPSSELVFPVVLRNDQSVLMSTPGSGAFFISLETLAKTLIPDCSHLFATSKEGTQIFFKNREGRLAWEDLTIKQTKILPEGPWVLPDTAQIESFYTLDERPRKTLQRHFLSLNMKKGSYEIYKGVQFIKTPFANTAHLFSENEERRLNWSSVDLEQRSETALDSEIQNIVIDPLGRYSFYLRETSIEQYEIQRTFANSESAH